MSSLSMLRSAGKYPTYVVFVLMLVYLVNQMDRYVLAVSSKAMARDVHFGTRVCELSNGTVAEICRNATDQPSCEGRYLPLNTSDSDNSSMHCIWTYSGTGIEYEILAGPVFIVMFTLVGVTLSPLADRKKTNRRLCLAIAVFLWSFMNILTSLSTAYWQLVLTRLGLGIFEAICTPFAVSLINDYFDRNLQGTALGIYNWGIYIGFSMAFALKLLIKAVGWRWTFRISGFPGIFLAALMLLTVKEPERRSLVSPTPSEISVPDGVPKVRTPFRKRLKSMLKELLKVEIVLVAVTSGVRTAGGYVLAYSVNEYFSKHNVNVAMYMSWVPLVGGVLGAFFGGFVSDRLSKKYGLQGRLMLLVGSQLLATPFAFGVVFLPDPSLAFISLLLTFAFGEAYLGVCIAIVTTMVSARARTFAVAVFIFVISNIGGNATLLVPELNAALPNGLQDTLTIIYCCGYPFAAIVFFITLMRLRHHQNLHTPPSLLHDVDIDDDEEFLVAASPVIDDDDDDDVIDGGEDKPLVGRRRSRPQAMTLRKVDDRDMAACQTWTQALAVNWRRSSIDAGSDSDGSPPTSPGAAASAPAHVNDLPLRTYHTTGSEC